MTRKRSVSAEKFVEIWESSSSVGEVAKRAGMPAGAATSRACYYRRRDIPLKKMPREKGQLDNVALKELVLKIRARQKKGGGK